MPIATGIYYSHFDDGRKDIPPVVLIHGAASNHTIWPTEIRRMAGQRVIAVDLPGHGRSTGTAQQSIRAYAEQMVDFFAAIGLYEAVFVGHDMGGAVALELAVNHSSHVTGLGLISTGASINVDPLFLENLANPLTRPTAIATLRQRAFGSSMPAALVDRTMQCFEETRPSVMFGDWRACADFDVREAIAAVQAPAWIIVGDQDPLTPVASAHFLAGKMAAARLQIIPGGGHMVLLEHPARIKQGLQQFLTALIAARTTAARLRLPTPAPVNSYQKRNP